MKGATMTRAHFTAIAEGLREVRPVAEGTAGRAQRAQWRQDVEAVAAVCKRSNPGFDRARFFDACGIEDADEVRA